MTVKTNTPMDTLNVPEDSITTTSLRLIREQVRDGDWTIMASIMGVGCEHVLYLNEDDSKVLYAVVVTAGSMTGIENARSRVRDFPVYNLTEGNPYPLVHLLTEAAHDDYLENLA